MPDASKAKNTMVVEADLLTWLTVHGNILLALRHPQNAGEGSDIARAFVEQLGPALVEGGIITQDELDLTMAAEGSPPQC